MGDNGARAAKLVTDFILARLAQHRTSWKSAKTIPPLFVGIQGPQGSGKSHLASQLPATLSPLRTASLSLDDLYLPHTQLLSLASSHPTNRLIQGRGQPGTHDLPLGISVLSSLARINHDQKGSESVKLPTYDKSLHDGQGDRSNETIVVQAPIDIVLFEGWCLGFQPLPTETLTRIYETTSHDPKAYTQQHLDYEAPFFIKHALQDLEWVNDNLTDYEKALWTTLDCFVQIEPETMSYIWQWRLEQQEHNMKAKNGGIGMTDQQVQQFIARQVPNFSPWLLGLKPKTDARFSPFSLFPLV
ncbi:BQ2448_2773 [Microbotryum intermedium]|uniref:BQ2448_2773 protein n=1 Tax=Microbotryum intermedium TaxID=269621 RepID=A0A238FDC9_9BASI|nr:BQ2448_2773 [Microbotryum intermedium]